MTRFWLLRHAIVEPTARAILYGRMDVAICGPTQRAQTPAYQAIARRLPHNAVWVVTPLSRTARTADAIQAAGYPAATPTVEPGLIEQDLGDWQGLAHADLPACLSEPAHAFWPLGATETPPNGESMAHVVTRVGETLERLAQTHPGRDVVAISHGGAIRAAIAHATGAGAQAALHFAIQNLSLTVLERFAEGWRIVCVNECVPAFSDAPVSA
jgi:broad specificity phosphatase PhoE